MELIRKEVSGEFNRVMNMSRGRDVEALRVADFCGS